MYDILRSVKSLLKTNPFYIDNGIFRLHKYTVVLLLVFSILVTSKQYVGAPMSCMANDKSIEATMTTYCWISATYTIPNHYNQKHPYKNALPLLGTYIQDQDEIKHYKYYQWVCFVLFFQAVLFYLPRYVWKNWEGGRIYNLTGDLKFAFTDKSLQEHRRQVLCNYFLSNVHNNNLYFLKFLLCELLNFANVLGQMFFLDLFLDGQFTKYGTKVLKFMQLDDEDRVDPMAVIFPKVTKCSMDTFGVSGSIQKNDALCILPLNNLNEKIYIFLWFWFILLAALSGLAVLYHLITLTSSHLRYILMTMKFRIIPKEDIWILCEQLQIGDWFMLYQVSRNVDAIFFKDFVTEMSENFGDSGRQFAV